MTSASKKPSIVVPLFQEDDALSGMPSFAKQMLEEKFNVLLERDLKQNPSLETEVQGICLMPSKATELLDPERLDRLKNLKVFSSVSAGYNHMPLEYLKKRGVRIGITPGVLNDGTAEMAIALILASARDFRRGMELAMGPDPVTSFGSNWYKQEVTGSTLGIVGMGGIGMEVARRAVGLKMNVLYHNRHRRADDVEVGATYHASLDTMLPQCDFVSISCPLTDQTKHLFSSRQFELMKNSAFLVNIARGAVVDTEALVAALQTGAIAGAGLDVTDPEPLPRDHALLRCANVLITPHWGSATLKTRKAMYQRAVDNLYAVLCGDGQMPSEVSV